MKRNCMFYLLIIAITVWGCYPEGPEYVDQLDVVYTNYDDEFEFRAQNTFSVPDSVLEIGNQDADDPEFVDPVYGDVIIAQIRQNLAELGWTEVGVDENPDVIILPTAMNTTNLYYHYNWNYWDWYYPGWSSGANWYYPGYYPGYISGYNTGTVFLQMTDPSGMTTPGNDDVPVVWNAVIDGLLQGTTENINERFKININQAFTQSPYLKLENADPA